MPQYRWRGVTLDARYRTGHQFAHSADELDTLLFKQGIALISCKPRRMFYLFPISFAHKKFFFEHLQILVQSGIHVWQALTIMSQQISDVRFADIVYQIGIDVQQGQALHDTLKKRANLFTPYMVHVVEVGMQADNLPVALHALSIYLEQTDAFAKRLRSVLLLPIMTLLVFISILLVILLAIVPRYADLFKAMGKELPAATAFLMKVSAFVASRSMWIVAGVASGLALIVWRMLRIPSMKEMYEKQLLHLPYIGPFLVQVMLVHFLRSLALLVKGGMPLVPALQIAHEAISNSYLKQQLEQILHKVEAGQSLSQAMQAAGSLFGQDLILMVTVGQETGMLADMLKRAADMYQEHTEYLISAYTTLVQPALMILLGLLIAGLIFAVYMPLFNLAELA